MDYVTRQFIVLTKKLRKELRKAISDLRNALKQQTEAIRKANKRDHEQQKPDRPTVVVQAELHIPENVETDRKSHEDRQHRLQIWVVIGTWAAFLAASVYAYVAIRQWREMIAVRHQAQESINAANRSAAAAESANATAKQQFSTDQRPYIWIVEPLGQMGRDANTGKFAWNVYYKNFGKSPAIHVRNDMRIAVGKNAIGRIEDIPKVPISKAGWIEPPGNYPDFGSGHPFLSLSDKELNEILSIEQGVVVFGRIDYSGTDGTEYWSLFCLARQANGAIGYCRGYSQIK